LRRGRREKSRKKNGRKAGATRKTGSVRSLVVTIVEGERKLQALSKKQSFILREKEEKRKKRGGGQVRGGHSRRRLHMRKERRAALMRQVPGSITSPSPTRRPAWDMTSSFVCKEKGRREKRINCRKKRGNVAALGT